MCMTVHVHECACGCFMCTHSITVPPPVPSCLYAMQTTGMHALPIHAAVNCAVCKRQVRLHILLSCVLHASCAGWTPSHLARPAHPSWILACSHTCMYKCIHVHARTCPLPTHRYQAEIKALKRQLKGQQLSVGVDPGEVCARGQCVRACLPANVCGASCEIV